MSNALDLNKLRTAILDGQQSGREFPTRPENKVFVTPDSRIVMGDQLAPGQERELAEVQQRPWFSLSPRLQREQDVVWTKMPANTRMLEVDGFSGWLYSFHDEFGRRYEMFVYFDGSYYQVKVVFPEVEGKYDPESGHLYPNGNICFGREYASGMPALEQAYAKSVLWAAAFTTKEMTGAFAF